MIAAINWGHAAVDIDAMLAVDDTRRRVVLDPSDGGDNKKQWLIARLCNERLFSRRRNRDVVSVFLKIIWKRDSEAFYAPGNV